MKKLIIASCLALSACFVSCDKSKDTPTVTQETVKNAVVNASDYAKWVYFSFEKGAIVELSEAEAKTSLDWDLAFHRYDIRTNSGKSGQGQGGAARTTLTDIKAKAMMPQSFTIDELHDITIAFQIPPQGGQGTQAGNPGSQTNQGNQGGNPSGQNNPGNQGSGQATGAGHASKTERAGVNHVLTTIRSTKKGADGRPILVNGLPTFEYSNKGTIFMDVNRHGAGGPSVTLDGLVYLIRTAKGKYAKIIVTASNAEAKTANGSIERKPGNIAFSYVYPASL